MEAGQMFSRAAIVGSTAAVLLAAPGSATARVHCSNSLTGTGAGGAGIKAYAESVWNMGCTKVHRLLLESWIWRTGTLVSGVTPSDTPADSKGAPGYPCTGEVYVPSRNFVGNQIEGATETCTRGRSNFGFTWGHRSRFTIPG
jgi:hypothetical protein